jgi:competence protein ComEC
VLEVAHLLGGLPWAAGDWRPGRVTTLLAVLSPFALVAALKGRERPRLERFRRRHTSRGGGGAGRWASRSVALAAGLGLLGASLSGISTPGSGRAPSAQRALFLDVGQGDAALLVDGESGILVDTGPPGTPIARMVEAAGVKRVVALVLTHGQADHAGAVADLLSRFRPEVVIDGTASAPGSVTGDVDARLRSAGVPRVVPTPGYRFAKGSFVFTVLSAGSAQAGASEPPSDPNDGSVVGLASIGSLTVLLTADAESPVLLALPLGPVDVIKLPHHGSSDPGLPEVLQRTAAPLGVIETGPNPYGHPTGTTLRAAAAAGRVLRTDLDGTVAVAKLPEGSLTVERNAID